MDRNTEVRMREYVGSQGRVAGLPLEDDNHYERDRVAQHHRSHDEQNDPELSNRKDSTIERKTGYETVSAHQT